MSSKSETGHAKNLANFEDLISFCVTYGAAYNPSKAALKLPALTAQLTAGNASLQAVSTAKTAYDNATNQREVLFAPVKIFATKIINSLEATDALQQTIDDARTIVNRIHGKRAISLKKRKADAAAKGEELGKTASTSRQSYDIMIDHYTQLINLLAGEPKYQPNENELKTAGLNTLLTDMKAKNTAVANTAAALSAARIARDKVLYGDKTGLVDTALAVKNYVRSIFAASSPQAKQVGALKFTGRPAN